jgi:ubiquinone/menaquinone biosynthesis C-methylase UbiE
VGALNRSRQKDITMAESQIRFDDGAGYERMMGTWSRFAGDIFLDWLAPAAGLRWLDVGCGNGAFTQAIVDRCAPAAVEGIDPSEGQLAFARERPAARLATFRQGDAMALPYADRGFDTVTMALVIFFVPDPVKAVAEMVRVTRPGGAIAAYAWDMLGGGFTLEPVYVELRKLGITPLLPPSAPASRMAALRGLWTDAGIEDVETREITVQRTFADFEDFWSTSVLSTTMRPTLAKMTPGEVEMLRSRVRAQLPPDAAGRITCGARANAVKGKMPG